MYEVPSRFQNQGTALAKFLASIVDASQLPKQKVFCAPKYDSLNVFAPMIQDLDTCFQYY